MKSLFGLFEETQKPDGYGACVMPLSLGDSAAAHEFRVLEPDSKGQYAVSLSLYIEDRTWRRYRRGTISQL